MGNKIWVWIRANYLSLGSVALILGGVGTVLLSKDIAAAANVGDWLAGFAGALAFLWLVASLDMQRQELSLQRKELKLQREAIEKQAHELRASTKLTTLGQVRDILSELSTMFPASEYGIANHLELYSGLYSQMMKHWKVILESNDAPRVHEHFLKWTQVEALGRRYLGSLASALRIYLEHHAEVNFDRTKDDAEFVFVYSTYMNKAPYLSAHASNAYLVSNWFVMFEPGLKSIQYAGLHATAVRGGAKMFKEGALEKLRSELETGKHAIPAIAKVPIDG